MIPRSAERQLGPKPLQPTAGSPVASLAERARVALLPGVRIGSHEVLAPLGVGGMGEVYRARDTKLGRDVALKVIPVTFALDADRLARFRREAQVLASLNHPHIGSIYGFEDSSETHALVLELVEGGTLADLIDRGPIPLDDALPIARQICEALEAAHEHGIVHRDLKPANIKVTPDGVVKVLDFGLAKLAHPERAAGPGDLTASPTITSPAMMTGVGVLLGTAAYMSPEQAKGGREADKRSDVWAFGCVLYEMLTGRRPFDGEDMTEVLGAVVRLEPDWQALPSDVPPSVRTLLQRCLVKDRRKRIADIAAALFVLDHQAGIAASSTVPAAPLPRTPLSRRIAELVAGGLVVAAVAAALTWFATRPATPKVVRTTITTSGPAILTLGNDGRNVAITPDGSRVVYRGNNQLLVRALDQLEPIPLTGLGAPGDVFVSPDGQEVGFFDGNTMKKVAITGGPPSTVSATQNRSSGATWSEDGTIVFATRGIGLQRVAAAGGEPTVLTKPDGDRGERDHEWPEFLPGGEAVLFTITSLTDSAATIENAGIAVLDLQTRMWKTLNLPGSHPRYVPTGHIVYTVGGTLRAVAFDLEQRAVVGTPVPVLEGLSTPRGATDVAVSANGSLVYVPGGTGDDGLTVVSVDRRLGRISPLPGVPADSYRHVRLSPDGTRLALATESDVSIYDFARQLLSRLTTDSAQDSIPIWKPDSQSIVFTSRRMGYPELFVRPADGTGSDVRLLTRAKDLRDLKATGWSVDGRQLLFTEISSATWAVGEVDYEHSSDVNILLNNGFNNQHASVSSNGRWMTYESAESGRFEIYVAPYSGPGKRERISTDGGRFPLWSRDGRELFFEGLDGKLFAVAVQPGTTLVPGRPQLVFDLPMLPPIGIRWPYDVALDGQRFLIIHGGQPEDDATASNLILVQNWFEELKRLVPVN